MKWLFRPSQEEPFLSEEIKKLLLDSEELISLSNLGQLFASLSEMRRCIHAHPPPHRHPLALSLLGDVKMCIGAKDAE